MKINEYPRINVLSSNDLFLVETQDGTKTSEYANVAGNKVDKIAGKGLSTNDYTSADKEKLEDINDLSSSEVSELKNAFEL